MTVSTFVLGLISTITDSSIFYIVAILARFTQGLGDIMLQITCYSVISAVFHDDVLRQISYIELSVGVGLGLGPTIGSILYFHFGYVWTMYSFGVLNTFSLVMSWVLLPKVMEGPQESEVQGILDGQIEGDAELSFDCDSNAT